MSKVSKEDIVDYFKSLCEQKHKKLSRDEYRKENPFYSSSLIENIWGNWTKFVNEISFNILRTNKTITFDKNVKRVVVSYIADGAILNEDFYLTLKNYCSQTNSELAILWGKSIKRNTPLEESTYKMLQNNLATEFKFDLDDKCLVRDYLVSPTLKNPLLNVDKLTTSYKTVIIGSPKQYLNILPYKQYDTFRVAYTTGTIGMPDYRDTIPGSVDAKYHTFGAILLEYQDELKRYIPRNLIFENNELHDLDKLYTKNSVKTIKEIPGCVLGDLHLPDEDEEALDKTSSLLNRLNPKVAMIHDVASWSSISHHDLYKYLTKIQNENKYTISLEAELKAVNEKLTKFTSKHKNTEFKVVSSNHDSFVEKWLNTGEFIRDTKNAKIGAKLFAKYLENGNILDEYLPKNVQLLPKNSSFRICGFELAEHGDAGISGAKGNPRLFDKGFEKIISGHTHSPQIFGSSVIVGTLSKLKLCYNQQGLTTWAHCNAIIHENGTFQLIFM